ncbi:hypothetical protein DM01DRAFT_1407981 [Hesseltinella vesiculosa]|uniref:Cyclin N-terminal domain-containing protein n=1 Tax=Hesseltinella vesiculosa TaxID=101127 RepID=A0A1X2GGI4_9FUNG|nr:hypothetical protein DM01DRAFT_1407981 [Hesseltinella vesiculosa]
MANLHTTLMQEAFDDLDEYQALFLLHSIRMRKREPLSGDQLDALAKSLVYSCDFFARDSQPPAITKVCQWYQGLMSRTSLHEDVDGAIKRACIDANTCIPVICPATTMVLAVYYLHRLQKRYGCMVNSFGEAQRTMIVAYLIAAKYIHANVQSVVGADSSDQTTHRPQRSKELDMDDVIRLLTLVNHRDGLLELPLDAETMYHSCLELVHFLDYKLTLHFSTAQIWTWFDCVLQDNNIRYHRGRTVPTSHSNWTLLPNSPPCEIPIPPAQSVCEDSIIPPCDHPEKSNIVLPPLYTVFPHPD